MYLHAMNLCSHESMKLTSGTNRGKFYFRFKANLKVISKGNTHWITIVCAHVIFWAGAQSFCLLLHKNRNPMQHRFELKSATNVNNWLFIGTMAHQLVVLSIKHTMGIKVFYSISIFCCCCWQGILITIIFLLFRFHSSWNVKKSKICHFLRK